MHEFNHEKLMTTSIVGHCTPYDSIKVRNRIADNE